MAVLGRRPVDPSTGSRTKLTDMSRLAYPKPQVQYFAETPATIDRIWGTSGNKGRIASFEWRDGNKVWHRTSATCLSYTEGLNGALFSHYRHSCTDGATISEYSSTYDDRR